MARDLQSRTIVKQVRAYVDDLDANLAEGRGLWLAGDVGTGKTTLAMLVSRHAIEAGKSVAIYSLPRLLARIRRTYDAEAREDSYLQFFDRLTSVDLLHIDDLGAEKQSDWVLEQLYAIVDERYQSQRAMIVTTNLLDFEELERQVSARTVSRLAEMCEQLPLYGADRRLAFRSRLIITPACPEPSSSAPSGVTRGRGRSPTCSRSRPTWSCASRAATTPATRSSATARSSSST